MASSVLEPFDRNRDFMVAGSQPQMQVRGKVFRRGDPLEKELLSIRTLRQLYESRRIKMLPRDHIKQAVIKQERINFESLPDGALISWLEARKVIPKPGTKREKLITMAQDEWERRKESKNAKIPEEWLVPNKFSWFELQKKVFELTGTRPKNKAQLIQMIRGGNKDEAGAA